MFVNLVKIAFKNFFRKNFNLKKEKYVVIGIVMLLFTFSILLSFFTVITLSKDYNFLSIFIIALLYSYNLPIIKEEFYKNKNIFFRGNNFSITKYILFLLLSNNIFFSILLIYLFFNLIFSFFSVYSISLVLITLLLTMYYFSNDNILKCITLSLIGLILFINYNVYNYMYMFLLSIIIIILFLYYFNNIKSLSRKKYVSSTYLSSVKSKYFIPLRSISMMEFKNLLYYFIVITIMLYLIIIRDDYIPILEFLSIYLLFNCEVEIDKKYENMNDEYPKFYLIYRSKANKIYKFVLSKYYHLYFNNFIIYGIIIFLFKYSIIVIGLYVFINFVIVFLYYKLEEKMFLHNKKTNTIIVQYFLIIIIISIFLVINYFKGGI
jgi:membrane protein